MQTVFAGVSCLDREAEGQCIVLCLVDGLAGVLVQINEQEGLSAEARGR